MVAVSRTDSRTRSVLSLMDQERKTAMDYYAGLDVSLEETSVCVVDGEEPVAPGSSGRLKQLVPRPNLKWA